MLNFYKYIFNIFKLEFIKKSLDYNYKFIWSSIYKKNKEPYQQGFIEGYTI